MLLVLKLYLSVLKHANLPNNIKIITYVIMLKGDYRILFIKNIF